MQVDDGAHFKTRECNAVADDLEVLTGGTERRAGNVDTTVAPDHNRDDNVECCCGWSATSPSAPKGWKHTNAASLSEEHSLGVVSGVFHLVKHRKVGGLSET